MPFFSIIIPVYNRPDEIDELLKSLTFQTFPDFEVLIIEDGSTRRCEDICKKYTATLQLRYFDKPNTGQGFSRNYGFERAAGQYFTVFDSDVIVPPHYFQTVYDHLQQDPLDAYGGADAASPDFSAIQKAISYTMTSLLTTGGIRSSKKNVGGAYQIRSYNMGISRKVWTETGGFAKRDMGEDMELSSRIHAKGFRVALIDNAYVYHKRRGNFSDFFKQMLSFGRTRIQLQRQHNIPIKLPHLLPPAFFLGCVALIFTGFCCISLFAFGAGVLGLYLSAILIHSTWQHKSIKVGLLSVVSVLVQFGGYGLGFWKEAFSRFNIF